MCLSVSLMESQVSRVTTSTAHGVLMRGRQSISPKVSRYRALSWARDPGLSQSFPELSSQQSAWPGLACTHSTLTATSSTQRRETRRDQSPTLITFLNIELSDHFNLRWRHSAVTLDSCDLPGCQTQVSD